MQFWKKKDWIVRCKLAILRTNVRIVRWKKSKLSDLIKNIWICVSKINEGFKGLERNEGE